MQLCVNHVDVHRAKNAVNQSKIKYAPAVKNLQKNAHVNPKNKFFRTPKSDLFGHPILSKVCMKKKWL